MSSVNEVSVRLAKRKKVHTVPTDEGTLYFRGLNGAERNEYFGTITEASDKDKLAANQKLVAMQLCNEDGSPAFESIDAALEVVMQWDISAYINPAVDAILKASGLKAESQDEAAKK